MKALYKLEYWPTGMLGIFVEEKEKVEWLLRVKPMVKIGQDGFVFHEEDIEMLTDDSKEVSVVERYDLEHGINPFWYPTGNYETVNEAYEAHKLVEFHKNNPYNIKTGLWV